MKKKLVVAIALAAVLTTGTAFAEFGIGVHGGWGMGGVGGGGGLNLAFSNVFVYIDALSGGDYGMHVAGAVDFLSLLNSEIVNTLSWYIRVGIGASFWGFDDAFGCAVSVRLPIGLSWRPIPLLELFLQAVPQIGLQVAPSIDLWGSFFGGNLGLRLWF